jgi:hypothetical protein
METRDNKKYLEFKKVRNQVKSLVKKAKHNMKKDIAKKCQDQPQEILAIRQLQKKNQKWNCRTKIQKRQGENQHNGMDKDKANVLANFFAKTDLSSFNAFR